MKSKLKKYVSHTANLIYISCSLFLIQDLLFSQSIPGFQYFTSHKNGDIYAGSTQGIFLSTDGGLNFHIFALDTLDIESIVFNKQGSIFASTYSDYGVFKSTDNGINWVQSGLLNQYAINDLIIDTSGVILAASHSDYVWYSGDNGFSWSRSNTANVANRVYMFVKDMNQYILAAHGGGVSRSTDGGINWSFLSGTEGYTFSVAVFNQNIFVGRTSSQGIIRSTDNGTSWVQSNSGFPANTTLSLLAAGDTVFAGTFGGGVFRSTNNGNYWTLSGLDSMRVYSLYKGNNGYIFAGVDDGIFYSSNQGASWQRVNSITSTKEELQQAVMHYELWQNYPNPFNPVTTISFSLPTRNFVSLKVYDQLGNIVAVLANEIRDAGKHSVYFNAMNLSSGIYVYMLSSGKFIDSGKMVLLK